MKQELFKTAAIVTQTSWWQDVVNVLPSLGQLDHSMEPREHMACQDLG